MSIKCNSKQNSMSFLPSFPVSLQSFPFRRAFHTKWQPFTCKKTICHSQSLYSWTRTTPHQVQNDSLTFSSSFFPMLSCNSTITLWGDSLLDNSVSHFLGLAQSNHLRIGLSLASAFQLTTNKIQASHMLVWRNCWVVHFALGNKAIAWSTWSGFSTLPPHYQKYANVCCFL